MRNTPFLGQDLYRLARARDDLSPFNEAAEAMAHADTPLQGANIFKAIRFGMAGIALDGWQDTITEPLPQGPVAFGSGTLEHRLLPSTYFPQHDHALIDQTSPHGKADIVETTQGEYALNTIRDGLQTSMRAYLATEERAVGAIGIGETLDALADYLNRGRALGLADVPNAYVAGNPWYDDTYRLHRESHTVSRADAIAALADTARNPIRFTKKSIVEVMTHFSGFYPKKLRLIPGPEAGGTYDQTQVSDVLLRVAGATIRASQRADGTSPRLVLDAEKAGQHPYVAPDQHGRLDVTWNHKGSAPTPVLKPGAEPPKDRMVTVTARNRCPIGYTPDSFTPMPIRKITDGIMYTLLSAGLHDPNTFSQPKVIGSVTDRAASRTTPWQR